jgi:hypothetical protein
VAQALPTSILPASALCERFDEIVSRLTLEKVDRQALVIVDDQTLEPQVAILDYETFELVAALLDAVVAWSARRRTV